MRNARIGGAAGSLRVNLAAAGREATIKQTRRKTSSLANVHKVPSVTAALGAVPTDLNPPSNSTSTTPWRYSAKCGACFDRMEPYGLILGIVMPHQQMVGRLRTQKQQARTTAHIETNHFLQLVAS